VWWVEAHTELSGTLFRPVCDFHHSGASFFMTTKFTTIYHSFRKAHKISALEYILCDITHFLCTNSRNEAGGWCYQKRENMAEEIGISKQGLLDMIERMVEKGFLVKHPVTKFLKTTSKWDAVYIDEGCFTESKETLPRVKKLGSVGKETLPERGKETLPIINTITEYSQNQTQTGEEEIFEQQPYVPPPMPNTILSEMTDYYIKLNPQYKKIATPKVDNPAIRQIAERITGNKMFHLQPEMAMKKWRAFCSVVLTNDFYCQKPLKTICNNIQTFLQDIEKAEKGHYTPPPSKNNSVQAQLIPQKVVLDGKKGYFINNGAIIRL